MKNQNKYIVVLGFLLCGLTACNSDTTTEQPAVIESPAPTSVVADTSDFPTLSTIKESAPAVTASIPPPTTLNSSGPLSPSNGPFATASNTPITVAQAPVKAKETSARLNPAHGQPGHNCALAVGAPLEKAAVPVPKQAKPAIVSVPQVETQAIPTSTVAETPNVSANPNAKINPAHGQPGHNCAVAVGAPLPLK